MRTLEDADLRELAALESGERAFVSCYLTPPNNRDWLEHRAHTVEHFFEDSPDDLEYFSEGMRMINEWLDENQTDQPAIAVFACYALDFVRGYALPVETENKLRLGPAPLIRPLAQIIDDHEDFVLVAADNDEAHIYYVSLSVIRDRERIKGDIKNHVKKGGWSQKRYQNRRANELQHYGSEVGEYLEEMYKRERFERLVIFGSIESRHAIVEHLSADLAKILVGETGADLHEDENTLVEEARAYIEDARKKSDRMLWDRIRGEYLSDGLAATGAKDVWNALANGQADDVIIERETKLGGLKCRACENVTPDTSHQRCPYCKSDDIFEIELVDEIMRQAERTSANVEIVDPIKGLTKLGGVASMLRY